MQLFSFIFPQTIAKFRSNINGEIFVKMFFGRKYLEVGGLTQSGPIVNKLFHKGIQKFQITPPKHTLVLGLGGGSVCQVLIKLFPNTLITGIEIDPVMITIGKKYFELDKLKNLTVLQHDAFDPQLKFNQIYDLIIVDLFIGYEIPLPTSNKNFLLKVKSMLKEDGFVVINRLYFQKYKIEAEQFIDKFKSVFHKVDAYVNYFNILILGK